jgi:hypothetical protein
MVGTQRKEEARIHLGLVVAELICVPAFLFETSRALSGNELSWAYVFEWPLLGVYAIYMWRRMLAGVRTPSTPRESPVPEDEVRDPDLVAWNEYLARRHP